MIQERTVHVEGKQVRVTISDENSALLAAKAAGRVVIGLLCGEREQNLSAATYLIEEINVATEAYLERVVRRHLGLPWIIGESERILIREFCLHDIADMETKAEVSDQLCAYIQNQYGFYEYGIWAVVRKSDGIILGKAGVSDCDIFRFENSEEWENRKAEMQLELGYYIFAPYRRCGYALEACRIILDYVRMELICPVYAVTDSENVASISILQKLEFQLREQKYSEAVPQNYLYEWNCL